MVAFTPYDGWLVSPEAAPRVVAPAYDAMTAEERAQLAAAEPDSFLNVMRSADDLPGGADPDAVLTASRHTLERLLDTGAFRPTEVASFHVLRMQLGDHVQIGLVGTVPVDEVGASVRLHEDTRSAKLGELVHHLDAVGVQSSPVGLVHAGPSPVADLLADVTDRPPDLDLVQADGLHQQVWTVHRADEVTTVEEAFAALPALYLTDGHHRAAAAQRFAERMRAAEREAGHEPDPEAAWEQLLVAVFPAPELQLHPYHRVVTDTAGRGVAELRAALDGAFDVEEVGGAEELEPLDGGSLGVWIEGRWLRLRARPEGVSGSVADLAVTVLQDRVLAPLFGIADARTDPRLVFVPGTLGLRELAGRAGRSGAAFALPDPTVEDLVAVADAGAVMPPKSTWFEPKLRSGVFLRQVRRSSPTP